MRVLDLYLGPTVPITFCSPSNPNLPPPNLVPNPLLLHCMVGEFPLHRDSRKRKWLATAATLSTLSLFFVFPPFTSSHNDRTDQPLLQQQQRPRSPITRKGKRHSFFVSPFDGRSIDLERDRLGGRTMRASCYDLGRNLSRCLPSVTLAGFPKAGTSALYYYLSNHPELRMPPKEFCAMPSSGSMGQVKGHGVLPYYSSLPSFESTCENCVVMEACIKNLAYWTPDHAPLHPTVYKSFVPTLEKVIVLVRNPLELAYAGYHYWCTDQERPLVHLWPCDLRKNSQGGRELTGKVANGTRVHHVFQRSPEDFHSRYIRKNGPGIYDMVAEVTKLQEAYGKENVHLFVSERLNSETDAVLSEITHLLGLAPHDFSKISKDAVNTNGNPGANQRTKRSMIKKYPPMLDATRVWGSDEVKRTCEGLEKLTGKEVCRYWHI